MRLNNAEKEATPFTAVAQPLQHEAHTHTHTLTDILSSPRSRKGYLRKRGPGLRRCVYTTPHYHTTSSTGSRAADEDERNTHGPTKPREARTDIRECGSNIKQKLEGRKISNYKRKGQPAGHGPGKSIEKFDRKFRLGDASNLNKRNGESQNS